MPAGEVDFDRVEGLSVNSQLFCDRSARLDLGIVVCDICGIMPHDVALAILEKSMSLYKVGFLSSVVGDGYHDVGIVYRDLGREIVKYIGVEHPFHIVKCLFGYKKVAYRGLAKNENRLYALFASANLYALASRGRSLAAAW